MRRREFIAATLATAAAPALAHAQAAQTETTPTSAPGGLTAPINNETIDPQTPLEMAFVQAQTNPRMRPIFRAYLLERSVVLAVTEPGSQTPREVQVRDGFRAGAIFTSAARMDAVLGADAPRISLNGRAALERMRGKNAVLNFRLVPMLTLDDEDVAAYLSTEGSASAGPTQ